MESPRIGFQCTVGHAVDEGLVGPAYQDISKKYAGQTQVVLVCSIKKGGAGKWGPIPMSAQAALTDADAATLGAWVLRDEKRISVNPVASDEFPQYICLC